MKIELIISTHCLGDDNTDDDNQRYVAAVKAELEAEYPDDDVSVELTTNTTANSCRVSDDPTGEIAENVHMISNYVWGLADY